MAGFVGVVDEVLIVKGLLEVLIYVCKVGVLYLGNIIQLIANTAV